MKRKIITLGLLLAALLGCSKQRENRHIVILPDVSESIDRNALQQIFKAIEGLVGSLHRGDKISIIPILGDAEAEASGQIIRFEMPMSRQAYDSDLRNFRVKLKNALQQMEAHAVAHPGAKTDILGSVALAVQEFHTDRDEPKRVLIILSDFIQEDKELDFRKDQRLANPASARQFATQFSKAHPIDVRATRIYLGLLPGSEYAALSRKRRDAIQDFWTEYLRLSRGQNQAVTDGIGLMQSSLDSIHDNQ